MRHGLSILVALASLSFGARAHVVLDQSQAQAGSNFKAVLRVGHGCGDSAVVELVLQIPPGVRSARPMAKPGWLIEQSRDAATKAVTQIRWTGGRLDAAQFDDFALLVGLPEQAGPLTFKVTQVCESGRADWAPVLDVLPASAPAAAHKHGGES